MEMPVLFVSHGNPMTALDQNSATEYKTWADNIERPEALVIFSAHWESEPLQFGETIQHQELVYDFYGFSDELYELQYPAPGAAFLIEPITKLLDRNIEQTDRGLDHGVWVPLLHMWPNADIPVLQMSLPKTMTNRQLFDLGQSLSALRQQGVVIIGAGTLSHNLRETFSAAYTSTPDWVRNFDSWVEHSLLHDQAQLLEWETKAPEAKRNHPSPEHFRPLLVALGAAGPSAKISFPISGFEMQTLSKRSVQFN
jgi:4,5-DOPA dioxygenase extradiol